MPAFDRVYILYPDPWPKRRQRKRRLVSDEMLDELARVMRPGAELRFASDIDDYIGWVLARALRSPAFPLDSDARRRLAQALRGLAGHPLRGEGDPRRPRAELLTFVADLSIDRALPLAFVHMGAEAVSATDRALPCFLGPVP